MKRQDQTPDLSILEEKGYSQDTRLLIIHADDLGMCHAANTAAIRAFKDGAISSASVMVPCPWFPEIAAWCRENKDADVGLHLTLTSEWGLYRWRPVTPIDKVKGLVDGDGFLWKGVEEVKKHASPQEVETELRAQIERALKFGMKPTHIDSHMGTLFSDLRFFEVYVKLGAEYKIPPMLMEKTPEVMVMAKAMGIDYEPLYQSLKERRFPMLTYLNPQYQPGDTYEQHKPRLIDFVRKLKPGITELIVHLGDDHPEGHAITSGWKMRVNECNILMEADFKRVLREEKIQLFTYRELAKGWR